MLRTMLFLLLMAGLAGAAPLKQKDGDRPSELEGKWVVTRATTLGQEQGHLVDTTFVIRGDRYTVLRPAPGAQGRVRVDAKASPRRVEFEVLGADGKPAPGKPGRWVYELVGDELRMASLTEADGAVPEKIDPGDPKQMVWTAKRVKD